MEDMGFGQGSLCDAVWFGTGPQWKDDGPFNDE